MYMQGDKNILSVKYMFYSCRVEEIIDAWENWLQHKLLYKIWNLPPSLVPRLNECKEVIICKILLQRVIFDMNAENTLAFHQYKFYIM